MPNNKKRTYEQLQNEFEQKHKIYQDLIKDMNTKYQLFKETETSLCKSRNEISKYSDSYHQIKSRFLLEKYKKFVFTREFQPYNILPDLFEIIFQYAIEVTILFISEIRDNRKEKIYKLDRIKDDDKIILHKFNHHKGRHYSAIVLRLEFGNEKEGTSFIISYELENFIVPLINNHISLKNWFGLTNLFDFSKMKNLCLTIFDGEDDQVFYFNFLYQLEKEIDVKYI